MGYIKLNNNDMDKYLARKNDHLFFSFVYLSRSFIKCLKQTTKLNT